MKIINLIILCFLLNSCSGGGSTGTGTISLEGSIKSIGGEPIAAATVSVENSSEKVFTDINGFFTLAVSNEEILDGVIALQINSKGKENRIEIETDSDITSNVTINVEIKIDPSDQLIVASHVETNVKIVGLCDPYFENLSPIRQSNKAPEGVNCTVKVKINGNNKPLSDVPFVLEYTGCSEKLQWNLLSAGETRSAPIPGVGQLEFKFFDTSEKCVYRIIAPYNLPGVAPVITKIKTFTKQSFDSKQ